MLSPSEMRILLAGLDTVQVVYYLRASRDAAFSFDRLMLEKERLRASKSRTGPEVRIGDLTVQLRAYGSRSGYPLVLEHPDFTIECGEFNTPTFFVTFRSQALWRQGAAALHQRLSEWASSVGLCTVRPETLSRVDFTFDYELPVVDFDADSVVSLSAKDVMYRGDRKVQTIQFGKGDIVLRLYDKVAEIEEQSGKVWLFDLWGVKEHVWRIEWQVRKAVLRRFGIRTFESLFEGQGSLLRYLISEHDSLRVPSNDSNRSRWPVHPLWVDLADQIEGFSSQGVAREIDQEALLHERLTRIAIAVYGYHKRVAALVGLRQQQERVSFGEAHTHLHALLERVHDPVSWYVDVEDRRRQVRLNRD